MLKVKPFIYACLALFVILLVFVVRSAQAQQGSGGIDLTVSPPVIELNAKPGDKLDERFRIRNNQATPTTLSIDVKKLSSDSNSGEPIPAEPTKDDEFISWMKVDPANPTVLPNEWQDVNFTLTIPQNAAYGYYYVLRIRPATQNTAKGTGTSVRGEVLVVVLLNVVKDGATAKGELVEFQPNTFVSEYVPVEFTAKVANKGNVHIKPAGNIFIRSLNQKDVATLDINAGKASVLPGGTRTFASTWDDGFIVRAPVLEDGVPKKDAKGNAVTKLTINWDKLTHFRIGPYTATLVMVYDDGKRDATIEGTAKFWLIPYTAIAVILISITVIVVILRFFLKWYVGRELKRQRKQ